MEAVPSKISFSVVIPTYESSEYIEDALRSVEGSSQCIDNEVILVDDCSNDVEALKEVASKYRNIKLIVKKKKTNAADSRNIGLKNSRSDFVVFLDSDDRLLPSALEHRYRKHIETKTGIVFGAYVQSSAKDDLRLVNVPWNNEDIRDYIFLRGGDFRSSTLSIYKPFYRSTKFDEKSTKHQDWIFGIRCWDAGESISYDQRPLSEINIANEDRMSRKVNAEASLYFVDNYLTQTAHINEFIKSCWIVAAVNMDWCSAQLLLKSYCKSRKQAFNYFLMKVFSHRISVGVAERLINIARRAKRIKEK